MHSHKRILEISLKPRNAIHTVFWRPSLMNQEFSTRICLRCCSHRKQVRFSYICLNRDGSANIDVNVLRRERLAIDPMKRVQHFLVRTMVWHIRLAKYTSGAFHIFVAKIMFSTLVTLTWTMHLCQKSMKINIQFCLLKCAVFYSLQALSIWDVISGFQLLLRNTSPSFFAYGSFHHVTRLLHVVKCTFTVLQEIWV